MFRELLRRLWAVFDAETWVGVAPVGVDEIAEVSERSDAGNKVAVVDEVAVVEG